MIRLLLENPQKIIRLSQHTSCSTEVESSAVSETTYVSVDGVCKSSRSEEPSVEELQHLLLEEKQKNMRFSEERASAKSKLFQLDSSKTSDSLV